MATGILVSEEAYLHTSYEPDREFEVYQGEEPDEQVFQTPPLIWIEVLSPEDRPLEVNRKVKEVLEFGVPFVWVIDQTLASDLHTRAGSSALTDGVLRIPGTPIEVSLSQVIKRWGR